VRRTSAPGCWDQTSVAETVYVDTNVVLRYLLGAPADQAQVARDLFRRAAVGELAIIIHPAVFAEVVYVMCSGRALGGKRAEVSPVLRDLVNLPGVATADRGLVLDALLRFEATGLDWVDALMLAYAREAGVFSFDKAMQRAGARNPAPG